MISHKLDRGQVEQVLSQVEAVTNAVRGIEAKADKAHTHFTALQGQREELTRQAEQATSIIDNLSDKLNQRSDKALRFFGESLDRVADLVEHLETTLFELNIQDAPRQIQREFGPLLVPAVVVVLVVTASNCVFGFLLAGDEALAESFSFNIFQKIDNSNDETIQGGHRLDILNLFAIFHVVLIGSAVLFLVVEISRKLGCSTCSIRKPCARLGDLSRHGESHIDTTVEEFDTNDLLAELERRSKESSDFDGHDAASENANEAALPSSTLERRAVPSSPRREIPGTPKIVHSPQSGLSQGIKRPVSHMLRRIQSASVPVVERITNVTASEQRVPKGDSFRI